MEQRIGFIGERTRHAIRFSVMVENRTIDLRIMGWSLGMRLTGVCVRSDSDERRIEVSGFLASALIGLAVLIVGLLIIHFTPDKPNR